MRIAIPWQWQHDKRNQAYVRRIRRNNGTWQEWIIEKWNSKWHIKPPKSLANNYKQWRIKRRLGNGVYPSVYPSLKEALIHADTAIADIETARLNKKLQTAAPRLKKSPPKKAKKSTIISREEALDLIEQWEQRNVKPEYPDDAPEMIS